MRSLLIHSSIYALLEKAPNSKKKTEVLKKYNKLTENDKLIMDRPVKFSDIFINSTAEPALYKDLLTRWLSLQNTHRIAAQHALF